MNPHQMTIIDILLEESMQLPIYIIISILGIMFGSFLNVLIYRIPKKEEFVKTSSHCMLCGHKLAWYDNIPLFSWLTLGGKCRYCKAKISIQYPIIEIFNGVLWLSIFLINGINIESVLICLMSSGLLAMSIIDWRTYEIANGWHFYFLAISLANFLINTNDWLSYVIGAFIVSVPLAIIYFASGGRAIGGGDVKLMASCGLFLGWKNTLLALVIACIVGSIIHILRMKISKASKILAMGPYLALGIVVASLFGNLIINWYLSLFLV